MSPRDPSDGRSERDAPSLLDRMRSLFGGGTASIRDDIEEALDEPDPDAVFSSQERTMLRNVLNLHEIRVEDIMVPRADMIAVCDDASLRAVLAVFREASHSRLPVHGETLDDPKGMVHIRDFVDVITASEDAPTLQIDMGRSLADAGILRPVLFVPHSMLALELLVRMQATHTHMALVIDEYGGTDGLVTIEDIVEVIVGDIADEHDVDEHPSVTREADGTFLAEARADLDTVAEVVGSPVATDEEAEDVDTLGGLVTSLAGRVPAIGEVVSGDGPLSFEVLDADPRRVKRVRIRHKPAPQAEAATGTPVQGASADP
ncbi:hemolysin family protein [Lichenihabitans sp. Uapishka_5]|uniref:hemolysin family protein n=1 Tax=Lichenihabitans sp. Uapishka_5 TaxID=3037302 RepID=UPI0029E7E61C|nr:hemolysin family protein [Lichenihabitans sp. Uapishka_5]MDX7950686.1 hemolysin family protein [Lichenihabitans sp. Uapishka_5]